MGQSNLAVADDQLEKGALDDLLAGDIDRQRDHHAEPDSGPGAFAGLRLPYDEKRSDTRLVEVVLRLGRDGDDDVERDPS